VTSELAGRTGGNLTQEIANAVVQHHKRFLGRGPTRAQAFFRHNFLVVVLEEPVTEAERRVAADGGRDAVLAMRLRYHETMRDELVSAVEELADRKVEAFLSGSHIAPDMTVELFVLDRPLVDEGSATSYLGPRPRPNGGPT
jgi:uncharacterized protein YbcI